MVRAIRNLGRPGVVSHAISAVDVALWDLRARLVDTPLFVLLGAARDEVPVYGSGGVPPLSPPRPAPGPPGRGRGHRGPPRHQQEGGGGGARGGRRPPR